MRWMGLWLAFCLPVASGAQNLLDDHGRIEDFAVKKRISLVFASQNLMIPETLFGHTFVVAHDEEFPEPDATVLEFVGLPDGSVSSYIKAISVGIQGEYHLKSFYQKQREYDLENRDFWVYPYTGTAEERQVLVERVTRLLRENRSTYSFISKNCATAAYVALSNDPLEKPYVLPIATINWLQGEGLLGPGEFHPSGLRKAVFAYNELTSEQKSQLRQKLADLQLTPSKMAARTSGALNAGVNFLMAREGRLTEQRKLFQFKKELLNTEKAAVNVEAPEAPEMRSQREAMVVGYGGRNYSLEFKPAQRDFFTSSRDGLETSFLDVAKMRGDLVAGKVKLSEVILFQLDAQAPGTLYSRGFTRLIEVGYWDWQRQKAERVGEFAAHYGWGYAVGVGALTLGLQPFVGLTRGLGLDQSGLDLGFRLSSNVWLSNRLAWQTRYKHRWKVDRRVADIWDTGALYIMRPNWRWGVNFMRASRELETLELKAIFTF